MNENRAILKYYKICGDASTRHFQIAVVRRLNEMGPKTVERRLNTLRRLFHPFLAEMWSMLKNVATLISYAPCRDVVDA